MFERNGRSRVRMLAGASLILLALVVMIAGASYLYAGLTFTGSLHTLTPLEAASKTLSTDATNQWSNDGQITAPTASFSTLIGRDLSVSPLFNQYYQAHGAAGALGTPITVAFPIEQGWLQFYTSSALFLPKLAQNSDAHSGSMVTSLINNGIKDANTGVEQLPLIQALLTVGSQSSIGGNGSPFSYVNLRRATAPDLMQPDPKLSPTPTTASKPGVFVKDSIQNGKEVGHIVLQHFWDYINRPDVSPDGWQTDFGNPLTPAVSFTLTKDGTVHHMQVQAFARNGLLLDQDLPDTTGQPTIQRLTTGVDYLRTVALPLVDVSAKQKIWVQQESTIYTSTDLDQVQAHPGAHFQLTLLGDTKWKSGILLYHVQWAIPKSSATGWISAADVTMTAPASGPETASIDLLSHDLSIYLEGIGPRASAVIYDVTRQRYYTYNSADQFITASSMKVPVLLTFLDMVEQQSREPDDDEMNLLTTMIENSNNDSTSELYFNRIGGSAAIESYMQKIGVTGLAPSSEAWGYSQITSQAMVDMLALLHTGKILNETHRELAINLMENVESDQQVGVGDTAPPGATVALKDGWVTTDNDLWAMNSSGIVSTGKETYIISVYTQDNQSLEDGEAIVHKVCSTVASLLI